MPGSSTRHRVRPRRRRDHVHPLRPRPSHPQQRPPSQRHGEGRVREAAMRRSVPCRAAEDSREAVSRADCFLCV